MELINVMITTGICSPEDIDRLTINMQMSDGWRKREAYSCRYFIWVDNLPLCSIKKIPQNGIYNIESIITTQNLFRSFKEFTAPEIYGTYSGEDGYFYIVEEFIDKAVSLDLALKVGQITEKQANQIYHKLICEIYNQPVLPNDSDYCLEEIDEIISTLNYFSNLEVNIEYIEQYIRKNIINISNQPRLTSGDLISRNILLTNTKPVVIDFDLSKKTKLLIVDVFRFSLYANFDFDINMHYDIFNLDEIKLYGLVGILSEIGLQKKILNQERFSTLYEFYVTKLLENLKELNLIKNDILYQKTIEKSNNKAQLFFDINDGFNEANSMITEIQNNKNILKFNLDKITGIKKLRLDPEDCPVIIELTKIEIESQGRRFKCNVNGTNADYIDGRIYYFLTDDPQIHISFESVDNIESIDNIVFQINYINMGFKEVKEEFVNVIKNKEKVILNQKDIIFKNNKNIVKLKECIDKNNKNIVNLKESINKNNLEIDNLSEQIINIQNSISWKITKPLRLIRKFTIKG